MSAQKSKHRRGSDEGKYFEKITTHYLIHLIFSLAVSNNHSHPHQNKNTRGASLQHRHLALEVARDHRQPIRSQEVVGATGEKILLHWVTALWKIFGKGNRFHSSWIIQGNLTLTSAGKTQLNFRGALLRVTTKPSPARDFISSKVSTALCHPQLVATERFCSPRVATSHPSAACWPRISQADTHGFSDTSVFCWNGLPDMGEGAWVLGHPKESPDPAPLQHPCALGGEPAERPGAFPRDLQEGLSLSSEFLRVRLFLTSEFLGVTQEEEFTWELQVEEGQPSEAD